ncbi:ABC transporter permease subunit [Lacticaseibacillus saniviri]
MTFFYRKHLRLALTLAELATLYLVACLGLGFQQTTLLQAHNGIAWMLQHFIPDTAAFTNLGSIGYQLWRTFVIATAATGLAGLVSLILALLGARNIVTHSATLSWLIRGFASLMRNIPVIAWALLLLFSFKQNELTGYLALFLMNLGFLTRAFMETIEDFNPDKLEALRATGASYPQALAQSLLPEISVPISEWLLYSVENNLRDATLVGLLTGTGVGFLFDLYFKSLNYPAAGLVVLTLVILVIALEMVANLIRKVIV